MDLWQRARVFAEEAAKRSQEISKEAAKHSQTLTRLSHDLAGKSRELAADTAVRLRYEAARAAGQIKSLASDLPAPAAAALVAAGAVAAPAPPTQAELDAELERFGVTDDLRDFVRGMTIATFRDFPLQDDSEMSEVPTVSNVRQDLNEWQAKHATLVLSAVKEISKFRYELCPRYMKERKFWQIYFVLVNSYVTPYEKKYFEELKLKSEKENTESRKVVPTVPPSAAVEVKDGKLPSKTSSTSNPELDLDVFLLGDLGSDDEGTGGIETVLDDDFDKIDDVSGLESGDDIGIDDTKSKDPSSSIEEIS